MNKGNTFYEYEIPTMKLFLGTVTIIQSENLELIQLTIVRTSLFTAHLNTFVTWIKQIIISVTGHKDN